LQKEGGLEQVTRAVDETLGVLLGEGEDE